MKSSPGSSCQTVRRRISFLTEKHGGHGDPAQNIQNRPKTVERKPDQAAAADREYLPGSQTVARQGPAYATHAMNFPTTVRIRRIVLQLRYLVTILSAHRTRLPFTLPESATLKIGR